MEKNKELQEKKEEFSRRFFYSILTVLLFNTVLCIAADYFDQKLYVVPVYFFIGLLLLVSYTGFLLHRVEYNFRVVYIAVICVLFMLFTYLSLLLCNISETVFLYYFPVVALFLMLHSFKKTILFVVFLLILCFFMPEISSSKGFALKQDIYAEHQKALKFQEYMVVAICTFYTFFILYYLMKFIEIKSRGEMLKTQQSQTIELDSESYFSKEESQIETDNSTDDKLVNLYKSIIKLMEEEKSFQYPDFSIRVLAEKLNSNTSYISAALNKIGNKKFNHLVNEYRIAHVKTAMKDNLHYKFTLEHIYSDAGFSSQSTFNRIFKEQTGVTPSEYIENLSMSNYTK
jgi:AraC-like DNA-binding protein